MARLHVGRGRYCFARCRLSSSVTLHGGPAAGAFTDVPRSHSTTVAPRLQNCIADVVDWCGAHRLQLNASKTDLLWYGSSAALQSLSSSEKNIVVGGDTIVPADVVRDLGVQFDCELKC